MQSWNSRILRAEKALSTYSDYAKELPDPEALKGSLFEFTKYFFRIRSNIEYVNNPGQNRSSLLDNIIPALESTLEHDPDSHRLAIRCPPRYGKTEILINYIAWALANYPDSKFMYVCYNENLATRISRDIRDIISCSSYKQLFGIEILKNTKAAQYFKFNTGGSVAAMGAGGTVLGTGAGIKNCDRFGGCIVLDDVEKSESVTSEKHRKDIKDWWKGTLRSRVNNRKTPIVTISQELHEDDLINNLLGGMDPIPFNSIILPALDKCNNALMPSMHTSDELLKMKEQMPYEFASMYQQNSIPAGGGLFKEEYFNPLTENIPENIISTFITVDTAETDKNYNDATVFSFWGIYNKQIKKIETDVTALHWIDCSQLWIEPKDLKDALLNFYSECMRFEIKPIGVAIEKKSTGVTLISSLKEIPGLRVLEIERTRASGNKSSRFIEMQQYIASKRISLHKNGKHTSMCIEHMSKITANDSHRYDDIADTVYDAVRLGLIDNTIINMNRSKVEYKVPTGYKARPTSGFKAWKK